MKRDTKTQMFDHIFNGYRIFSWALVAGGIVGTTTAVVLASKISLLAGVVVGPCVDLGAILVIIFIADRAA